jgi:nicotinamidase-related amidase
MYRGDPAPAVYRSRSAAMPSKNPDLHGNVPDSSPVVLVLIDVINDLEFEGGEALAAQALPMAERLAALTRRARKAGVAVVYVNDNFGKWRSDFRRQLEHVLRDGVRGQRLAELLAPEEDDYFVLKPKHSGFYSTTLDTLLDYLQARTLVLTGLTTNSCVLFTASDAYMRDLAIVVPEDCVAAQTPEEHAHALQQMRVLLKADTTPSTKVDFAALARDSVEARGQGRAT